MRVKEVATNGNGSEGSQSGPEKGPVLNELLTRDNFNGWPL
jgi:hypothetical protein